MLEPQHLIDLQDGATKSWLLHSEQDHQHQHSPPPPPTNRNRHHQRTLSNASSVTGTSRNAVDPNLYHDLVEFFPLVQSYLDRDKKKSSSFTRRGSMVYTKTPSKESLSKKITEMRGRNTQSTITKKRRDLGDVEGGGDGFLIPSARNMAAEKDREELKSLREQVEDLQTKLLEKDELLKSAELSKNQINEVYEKLNDLNNQSKKKDSLIHSTQSQLTDAKIKLADKQAALEKTQWEAMTCNKKVEKLQEDLDNMNGEMLQFVQLFESLTENDTSHIAEDYDFTPYEMKHLPQIYDMDETELQRMEEARIAYVNAVSIAKDRLDEESIADAANARLYLQSFVFRTEALL